MSFLPKFPKITDDSIFSILDMNLKERIWNLSSLFILCQVKLWIVTVPLDGSDVSHLIVDTWR